MQFGKVLLLKMAKTGNLVSPSDHTVRDVRSKKVFREKEVRESDFKKNETTPPLLFTEICHPRLLLPLLFVQGIEAAKIRG